ncbi:MAG TPA: hypothetical protein VGD98_15230 [Ktedonobacteraceae bacterium]
MKQFTPEPGAKAPDISLKDTVQSKVPDASLLHAGKQNTPDLAHQATTTLAPPDAAHPGAGMQPANAHVLPPRSNLPLRDSAHANPVLFPPKDAAHPGPTVPPARDLSHQNAVQPPPAVTRSNTMRPDAMNASQQAGHFDPRNLWLTARQTNRIKAVIDASRQKTALLSSSAVEHATTVRLGAVSVGQRVASFDLRHPLMALRQASRVELFVALAPFLSVTLWAFSLHHISVQTMNDFGLISAMPPGMIVALVLLMVSFAFALQRREINPLVLTLHIVCLIMIIDATQNLVEEAPRFDVVYRHAGYTEYIMRTGTVNPNLDAYFSWPLFFVFSAFITRVFGYTTILSYAGWAPLFYSLIYCGPLYLLFSTFSTNKRLVWLAILFFYLTNWIGQEYFSPQGLDFFFYLTIMAMVLKWCKILPGNQRQQEAGQRKISLRRKIQLWFKGPDPIITPLRPWQRWGMLGCMTLLFTFVVSSHQLTPFFLLIDIGALVIFRRCRPFWLPLLMLVLTVSWIYFMAGAFLAGHSNMITGDLGNFFTNVSTSTAGRASAGDTDHHIISDLRLLMTGLIWMLGFLGCLKRMWQKYYDVTPALLACAGFLLIAVQSYGGEMFLRIYLFTLPFMCFFAAGLLCGEPLPLAALLAKLRKRQQPVAPHARLKPALSPWMVAAIVAINLILLSGFFFTRYGNERVDYTTYNEWNGVQYLYQIAPTNSVLIQPAESGPLQYEKYESYTFMTLTDANSVAVFNADATPIVQFIQNIGAAHIYVLFTRQQQAAFTAYDGGTPDDLAKLEAALLATKKFQLLYSNPDAQILSFITGAK